MPKIMEIIKKETNGKSYHTYKYSYDSISLPSIDYDEDKANGRLGKGSLLGTERCNIRDLQRSPET